VPAAKLPRVHDESHLEEMRAALRGDRERAEKARQRSLENVRAMLESPASEPPPLPQRRPSRLRRLFRRG
jgi:hypothetical protein